MDAVEVAVGVTDDDEDDLIEEEICGGLELDVVAVTKRVEASAELVKRTVVPGVGFEAAISSGEATVGAGGCDVAAG